MADGRADPLLLSAAARDVDRAAARARPAPAPAALRSGRRSADHRAAREEPRRRRGRTSASRRAASAIRIARRSAARPTTSRGAATNATRDREHGTRAPLHDVLRAPCQPYSPQTENGESARGLEARACDPRSCAGCRRQAQDQRERCAIDDAAAGVNDTDAGRARRARGVRREQRRERQRRELRRAPRARRGAPRATGEPGGVDRASTSAPTSASLALQLERVERERVRHPGVGERRCRAAARAAAARSGTAARRRAGRRPRRRGARPGGRPRCRSTGAAARTGT